MWKLEFFCLLQALLLNKNNKHDKEKTLSVNKQVRDHNITEIKQVSIRSWNRLSSRNSSGRRTKAAQGMSVFVLAVFVHLLDESLEHGQNQSWMLICIIPVMLRSLTCLLTDVVFSFSLDRYSFPPGAVISLVPLWFLWWFYVIINM